MNDDPLKRLLTSADVAVPPALLQEELLKRIRPRARRARIAKIILLTTLSAALPIVPLYFVFRAPPPPASVAREGAQLTVVEVKQTLDMKAQIAALEAEAIRHEVAAESFELRELRSQLQQSQARAAARDYEQMTADRCVTAQLMINRADDLARNPADRAEAARGYQRVIELFSQTPQAAVAQKRLEELKTQS